MDLHALTERIIDGATSAATPALSPDGSQVAFVVATTDLARNRVVRRIWIEDEPVTDGPDDTDAVWSPDGRHLAFVSRRTGDAGASLHVMPVTGPGEVRTICTRPERIVAPTWSPDGAHLAFISRVQDPRDLEPDVSWHEPREITRFFARLDGEGWIADRPTHVWVVNVHGAGTPTDLTPGPFQYHDIDWLPDGTALATAGARHESWDRDLAEDLHLVTLDGEVTTLTNGDGVFSSPSVSADGRLVAFLGHDDPMLHPQNARIGVLDLDTRTRRWIDGSLDRTTISFSSTHRSPIWLDPDTVLALAEDRGRVHLHRFRVDGGEPEPITAGEITVQGFDHAAGTTAMAVASVDRASAIVVRGAGGERRPGPEPTRGRTWERLRAPCADGSGEIDTWIMRPEGPAPASGFPVLLNVHGGPFAQYGETYFDEAQLQTEAGFAVVMCNPRGSSGRDSAWGWAINGPKHPRVPGSGWGTVDTDDVLAALDHALDHADDLDRDRVGMIGGSYGGYMATLLAARHGERFRAICSERAVNDLLALEWSSDIATMFRATHGVDAAEDPDEYLRRSPVRDAHRIEVPMLLLHSEDDLRCPIAQAEQLWVTLRLLDRDVRFVRFPGEGHELSRSGSPRHRHRRAEIVLGFFTDHLAGDDEGRER